MKLHLQCDKQNFLLRIVIKLLKNNRPVIDKLTITCFLYFFCNCLLLGCNNLEPNKVSVNQISYESEESYKASNELLEWLSRRVDMLVKYKANCRNMALALVKDQTDYADKLKTWRKLGAGQVLAQRAIKDLEFARKLNQLILKGDLVHSYCAYQSDFRDLLERLNSKG